ncbi:RidA family protein [Mesorhizobium qingshengii]|uniref:2-iminobutanoate/2-iminopropanoate deaminase n=1 Tax=Mesorhizobium qingshengii TaxID=1165689 RepID=A0A1G5Z9B9_9HYPH|nr:Rid family detoxifying hydrolase [Mesorhizobium qingshengii]SDA91488.1 2-iminobutanoate/2-iminopropanoate deaminase [Mesorhizobium qingshengii]
MTRHAITSEKLAPVAGPFSPAMKATSAIYLSGQVAQDPVTGKLIPGDVKAQAEQIFANLKVVLEAAGKTLADVVRVGVYLTDISDFAAVNEVYARHFNTPFPARTCIGVAALPLGATVEIDLIAN